ncbi:hypothetical protein C7S18_06880 [Ahniella affigens]|uniref:DUF11 domain-containing protein n=2 Tax=Ahniella affigens TaxID=2021234 RepID=A0A2P1PQ20_9GAMM|nr:hypothetical protein C7S18_06880 [Ahniella affigens]
MTHRVPLLRCLLAAGLMLQVSAQAHAQEPPCVAVPESGRSCVDVLIAPPSTTGLGRTGISSFDLDNEPGRDAAADNHVVRTVDVLQYELRYRVLHDVAADLQLQATLPSQVEWAEPPNPGFLGQSIPSFCLAGSNIAGNILTCHLGSVAAGTTRNVVLRTRPKFGLLDGAILRLQTVISASNQQTTGAVTRVGYQDPLSGQDLSCTETRLGQTVNLTPCGDIVSAAPRFDLEFSGYSSTNLLDRGARGPQIVERGIDSTVTTVVGSSLRDGFVIAYPIAIALPGEGLGGAPATVSQPIVLTERLRNTDGLSNFGELIGCDHNGSDDPVPNGTLVPAGWAVGQDQSTVIKGTFHPYGQQGVPGSNPDNSVADAGQMHCTQSTAGGDITITLTPNSNTFNPSAFPTLQVDNQVVPRRYVFVGMVLMFYPSAPVLRPEDGGTGDGSVGIRIDVGVLQAGQLRALSVGGETEPDALAINDGFGGVSQYDDDNNNFSIATLDTGGTEYSKTWMNPRRDGGFAPFDACLKDHSDPNCRHGYTFPGRNLQSNFFFSNNSFTAREQAEFCDEWDTSRTILRMPFDTAALPIDLPPGVLAYLELGGGNATDGNLNGAQFSVEVSTQAGTVANIDWDSAEPARTLSRSQASAPECSSGTWIPLTLPATLTQGRMTLQFPTTLESPPGSGRYPSIRRMRVRTQALPPFVSMALRGSYDVVATQGLTRLPNRTSYKMGAATSWTYAENDHAIVRLADTNITMTATRNLTTGATGPLTTIGFAEVIETTIQTQFSSGDNLGSPSTTPLIVKAYLPASIDYVAGSASPALAVLPYAGLNPDSGQAATVLEWRLPNLIPGQFVTPIVYHSQLNFSAGNQATVHSSATVEHALDPGPLFVTPIQSSLEDRLAFTDLQASMPVGLLLSHQTLTPFIDVNGVTRWQLQFANTSGAPFSTLRLIDVLPAVGDIVNLGNSFQGTLGAGQVGPLNTGEHLAFYTLSPRADINRNPNCASNGGSLPDGSGSCPAVGATWLASATGSFPADVTAIRIDDQNGLQANSVQQLELQFATLGNRAGDRYENSFAAVAPGESLTVASTRTQVYLPEGTIRGVVFADIDSNQLLSNGDFGIGAVTILLSGRDTQGRNISSRLSTVSGTQAAAIANVLSIDGGPDQTFTCTPSTRLTRGEFLFCRLPSADSQGYSLQEIQPADFADRNEVLGTLANGGSAGTVGNDVFNGIRVTNNLITGAGDQGTLYAFAEFPLLANVFGRVYLESSVPPNVFDDDEDEDPGLMLDVSIQCNPPYAGNAIEPTNSSGRYQFSNVPVGATCTITEPQPSGYYNAYNTLGSGGVLELGGTGTGGIDSQIVLVVPPIGSFGNNFAETLNAPVVGGPPRPVPVSPNLRWWLMPLLLGFGLLLLRARR